MTKFISQILILIIGLISLGLGICTMLQTPTLILPPWYLVLIFLPISLLISLGLGFLIKKILKSEWHTVTFTSIILTITCLTFFTSEYRPTYIITIPKDYVGDVKLFLSNSEENKLEIKEFGIGYLNEKTYKKGFRPIIIKNDQDITEDIKGYGSGAFATSQTDKYEFVYVSFTIPLKEERENSDVIGCDELIRMNAIDTTLLKKK